MISSRQRPKTTADLEKLANAADAWAALCEQHSWTRDTRGYAQQAGSQLREKAARIRALLMLQTAASAQNLEG